jgi:hypothetical protein
MEPLSGSTAYATGRGSQYRQAQDRRVWDDAVLTAAQDRAMLQHVQAFNPYDLYSKSPQPPDWNALRPYYTNLAEK